MTGPSCSCAPGARCNPCRVRSAAKLGLMRSACDRRETDPVTYWDRRTSLADYRTALCLAMGVPLELIHPASGHNMGRVIGKGAAPAVGRFRAEGPLGYRARSAPSAPLRDTRAEAMDDEADWRNFRVTAWPNEPVQQELFSGRTA